MYKPKFNINDVIEFDDGTIDHYKLGRIKSIHQHMNTETNATFYLYHVDQGIDDITEVDETDVKAIFERNEV